MIKKGLPLKERFNDKERKNLAILQTIQKYGPLSLGDISRITHLNLVTVSNYVSKYCQKGLILQTTGEKSNHLGRQPGHLKVNPEAGHILSIGLTPTHIQGLLLDLEMNILSEIKEKREPHNTLEVIEPMLNLAAELLRKNQKKSKDIIGIGISIPGAIDEKDHTVCWPQSLDEKDVIVPLSLKEVFEKRFEVPTYVENDANASALAEKHLSLEGDAQYLVYFFSGVSCGMVFQDEIYRGTCGTAGEVGIHCLDAAEKDAAAKEENLGRWGIDLGIILKARQAIESGTSSILTKRVDDIQHLCFEDILWAANEKDALVMKLAQEAGKELGRKIAFLVNFMQPEVIILGGRIEELGPEFIETVRQSIKEWALEEVTQELKIVPAALGERAITLGAACIVIQQHFSQIV